MLRNAENDLLFSAIAEEFTGKIYYFSLKKTGNSFEAEDLTSDIMLNVFQTLVNGNMPQNMQSYVWQIARNRYSVWAERKKKLRENISASPIDDYEISDTQNTLDEMIKAEQKALLRRELAFITKDYREIIVKYYIDNKSVGSIAENLKLPKGTVMSKLHRARKLLKEGINMAREFGLRSYNPEEICFISSGSQPSGLPWKVVDRMIPKNILLQASNNPSTVEELAIELGVAVPYMEEEVAILEKATLLTKQGDKYVTNFFILDKETQIESYNALRKNSVERSAIINELTDTMIPELRNLGAVRNNMSDGDVKWWLFIHIVDILNDTVLGKFDLPDEYQKRANGETWSFVGYEDVSLEELGERLMIGCNGHGDGKNQFYSYKINDCNMCNRMGEMDYREAILLADIIRNKRKVSDLTESEKEIFNHFNNKFVHCDTDGNVIPDILVLQNNSKEILDKMIKSHLLFAKLETLLSVALNDVIEIIKKNITELLFMQRTACIAMELFKTRMMTMHDLVLSGGITVPEDPDHSTVAMCIIVA